MLAPNSPQKRAFEERLRRIQSGEGSSGGQILVGVTESAGVPVRAGRSRLAGLLRDVTMLPLIFAAGFAALVGGRVIGFRYLPEDEPLMAKLSALPVDVPADIASALVLLLAVAVLLRCFRPLRGIALAAGFVTMMVQEPVLVAAAPELWGQLYTPAQVTEILTAGRVARL